MNRLSRTSRLTTILGLWLALPAVMGPARAEDWPTYRHDNARTAVTGESLTFPLKPLWQYHPAHPPQPAWPDPFLQRGRGKDFDVAPQPVVAGHIVYFGSTTDNTLWALDLETGRTVWTFTTGAPIRFAPAVSDDRLFLVSDDGLAYCLEARTGRLLWKFFGGDDHRLMAGNGRLISRWPIRSGVAVQDGQVHFASGMWSAHGVYVYALDARTGKVLWCNDTNLHYLPMPHASTALAGNMPQGYLALAGQRVVYNNSVGGTWTYDSRSGRPLLRTGGDQTLKKAKGGNYRDYPPSKFFNWSLLILDPQTGNILHHGQPEPYALQHGLVPLHAALAGRTLLACRGNQVQAIDQAGRGKVVWQYTLDGRAAGIAVANGHLLVSSSRGTVYCFAADAPDRPARVGPGIDRPQPPPLPRPLLDRARPILAELARRKIFRGYAVVLGENDARLAQALAAETDLQVLALLTDAPTVAAERHRLLHTTDLYGIRLTVIHWPDTSHLPLTQYLANLIVLTQPIPDLPPAELLRVQRPCGGLLINPDGSVRIRGKLPGALDWDASVTCDQRLRSPLELLWFGPPGPTHSSKMTPCTAAEGRFFVFGPSGRVLTAVDAYNGTVLWQKTVAFNANLLAANDRYVLLDKQAFDVHTGRPVENPTGPRPQPLRPLRSPLEEQRYLNLRHHPFTDALSSKAHLRLHGCGSWISAAAMEFFRSSTIAYYDYADDSGIRNFGGVRPGCNFSLLPALGLLLYGESTGVPTGPSKGDSCSCAYPFKTSLALAPATHRPNEDWAVFQDIPWVQAGSIRHAAINCGAPGDRRDQQGTLWLAAPRPQGPSGWEIYKSVNFTLPYKPLFYSDQPRSFRANADHQPIRDTDKPWLYASGYLGIKSLTWELDYYNRYHQYLAPALSQPPTLDGRLDEPCWSDTAELLHPYTPALHNKPPWPYYADPPEVAYARYDDHGLYLAYRKKLRVDRFGNVEPLKTTTSGRDAPVWNDDSFEWFLAAPDGSVVLHFGIAASGAAYDARLTLPALPDDPQAAKTLLKSPASEDPRWNGQWTWKVHRQKTGFSAEVAIPWPTLEQLGMDRHHLKLNLAHLRSPWGRKPFTLAVLANSPDLVLSQTRPTVKPYTLRLHFAEPTATAPGRRRFDVVVNGKLMLENFDVFAESGGRFVALARELRHIPATHAITLQFICRQPNPSDDQLPILNGLEVIAEQPPGPIPPTIQARLTRFGRKCRFVRFDQLKNHDKSD